MAWLFIFKDDFDELNFFYLMKSKLLFFLLWWMFFEIWENFSHYKFMKIYAYIFC